jgi:hypothetical protein
MTGPISELKIHPELLNSERYDDSIGKGIDVKRAIYLVWSLKWRLIICAVVVTFVSAFAIRMIEPRYTARMMVSAASAMPGPDQSQQGSLSSLSLLARGNVAPDALPFERYMLLLQSHMLAERLLNDHLIDVVPFLPGTYDSKSQSWLPPSGTLANIRALYRDFFGLPRWAPPDAEALELFLANNIKVERLRREGLSMFAEISLTYRNREQAIALLNIVHREADSILREEARLVSKEMIDRQYEQLRAANYQSLQQAISYQISKYLEYDAKLSTNLAYSAYVLEDPSASRLPVFPPAPTKLLPAIFILTIFIGAMLVVFWNPKRK